MIKIGICGAKGKMGKELSACLKEEQKDTGSKTGAFLGQGFDRSGDLRGLFDCDVIIDFSAPACTRDLLSFALTSPKPIVIGTTGLDENEKALMKEASKKMPLFYATNMSLGVAVLNHLAKQAATLLRDFDIEILEMHHRHKKDAPSGTAITLAETVAGARNLELSKVRLSGRDGIIGARSKDEIAVMSLRGGDVVGQHRVGFYEDGEFIELCHNATSRATFARGAIKIAKWLIKQENGFYGMGDFLGI
ncbi:4-hydroxy-tetrahydrodipicolinate reductase [Campylobacter troglodytis]|uniref:4-hydroxy-tetrahydrodipicolinate reductase n=1 Tax=Campylobacter troglodytis TaxID=654363 RepID=UPI0011571709|nr:4-hydroxy-tetrahydrodipicolinate reductase [Campylobacter troglodytis]TQR54008.1 4-hydroxy-tetrahydrodipicolinate reductase [Campylobacter troglodytis]